MPPTGGKIVVSQDLAQKGIIVKTEFQKKHIRCWVYNVSGTPVLLERDTVIGELKPLPAVKDSSKIPATTSKHAPIPVPKVPEKKIAKEPITKAVMKLIGTKDEIKNIKEVLAQNGWTCNKDHQAQQSNGCTSC